MMYSVYQHWDPLKVCIVGRSYAPEFYSFIKNSRVRSVMERVAFETEEDYQKLIKLLESFRVKILRPDVSDNHEEYLNCYSNKISPPPMTPRDYSIMLGKEFYWKVVNPADKEHWNFIRGADWPKNPPTSNEEVNKLSKFVINELTYDPFELHWKSILNQIEKYSKIYQGVNLSVPDLFNSAMTTRVGKDLYFGTPGPTSLDKKQKIQKLYSETFPDYRCHIVDTEGHNDGTFCPVVPGLIISLKDIQNYKKTFPDWEVIYLPVQRWSKVKSFLDLKEKNHGKWWVPGEELNDDFTNFVESWLDHWVGYVEETVFDVNMLVIDEKNVICNNYNEKVFRAFERYGITAHVINFRHRYFWDGGLHCITSDVHREGTMKDYFPERN